MGVGELVDEWASKRMNRVNGGWVLCVRERESE